MLDGFIARRTKSTSKVGSILDSIADIVFVIIAMIKILPVLNLSNAIIIWASIIALIKIMNIIFSYICYKKVVLPHTFANKITGLVLFVTPLIIVNFDSIIFEIGICVVATFSAIQEGYYIKTKK
jgi:CDP-diacylglycerol--glycerol-3-phosphate 3-phosphatidyltransferase